MKPWTWRSFPSLPIEVDHGPKLSTPIENLGFVIQCPGGHVILLTGDIACPGNPPKGPFDTVVLPVGGAGFVFGTQEALDFLNLIGHRGRVIPVHDTGPSDHGAADRFTQLAPAHLDVIALAPGASTEVSA